jgi:ABC-type branched-subunit amino acid transport system substrate-binding protein
MRQTKWAIVLVVAALLAAACGPGAGDGDDSGPIKIGIIADLTGPFTTYGTSLDQSARLAIKEINEAGGIAGRQIEVITEDIQTDVSVTVDRARKLVEQDDVDLVMGPIGSDANDAAARVVVEDAGKLLFYTETYEGGKCLPTYFSFGAVPAQQIRPFIPFLQEQFGPRVLLFGADYVWPRRSFEIAKPIIAEAGGEVVGEVYLPLVAEDFTELIQAVRDTQPDYIFSLYPAVFGAALKALDDAGLLDGIGQGNIFVGDPDLPGIIDLAQGMYTTLPYFTAVDTPAANAFLQAFQAEYGPNAIPSGGEGVGAYVAVYLYKQAVEQAGSTDPQAVAEAMVGQTFDGPTGRVEVMPSHHLKQTINLVRAEGDGYVWVESFEDQDPEEPCIP